MYISPKISWLRPYLEIVDHLVPVKRIDKILATYNRKNRSNTFSAQITKKSGRCYLSIYVDYIDDNDKIKPLSKIDILISLAHELAHLIEWNHTPNHKLLECEILIKFMYKLKQEGYISEERESKERLKCTTW